MWMEQVAHLGLYVFRVIPLNLVDLHSRIEAVIFDGGTRETFSFSFSRFVLVFLKPILCIGIHVNRCNHVFVHEVRALLPKFMLTECGLACHLLTGSRAMTMG